MAIKIDKATAENVLRTEAAADGDAVDLQWVEKVKRLSVLCDEGSAATHIAFLGTSILAKSINHKVDLFAIKPDHAQNNSNAYSARSLCHAVLVPLAAELGFSIGVTGREPLNNQPYFRMTYLGDGTPVHQGSRAAFDYMIDIVKDVASLESEAEARQVLRAFVSVRRQYRRIYAAAEGEVNVTPTVLLDVILRFVAENSEGGKRAQAVVAGLMDVVAGGDRVESGRVNDPSRRHPGDVCVRGVGDTKWEKAIEVRDKPVSKSDVRIFVQKCLATGAREAAVVAVSPRQLDLDEAMLSAWAIGLGIGLTIFPCWRSFVEQALFWAPDPQPVAAARATHTIRERLMSVEASPAAVTVWSNAFRGGV